MTLISVIIPTYNRSRLLSRCLNSVMAQTLPADEVIVIDDGSTDDTAWFLREDYPSIHYIYQDNHGVSAARNAGIQAATGEWLAFLDSDDVWEPAKLARQLTALKENKQYLVAHTNETWLYKGKPKPQQARHRKYGGRIFQHCLPLCAMSPSSIMIHCSVFEEVGLFDESLPACEDYDMWLRITARLPVLLVDEPLITKHGGHADQLSQQYWGMDRFRITALRKILQSGILEEQDRRAAIAMLLVKIRIYLEGASKHGNEQHVAEFRKLVEQFSNDSPVTISS